MKNQAFSRVRDYLTEVGCDMIDEHKGFVTCPGKQRNTTPDSAADCKLFDNGGDFFQLHCHHQSCSAITAAVNRGLAAHAQRARAERPCRSVTTEIERPKSVFDAAEADEALRHIRRDFPWTVEDMLLETGDKIGEVEEQHYQLLSLFDEADTVWCGRDARAQIAPQLRGCSAGTAHTDSIQWCRCLGWGRRAQLCRFEAPR